MLQLILGRSGYGKTTYVFNKIKELVNIGDEDIMLITPEQFSFESEKQLLSALGDDKVNSVECFSFSRLSNEIKKLYGGSTLPVLSAGSKAVMMKKAIEAVCDGFVLFDNKSITPSFINSIISVYDEMKSCRVSADDIIAVSERTDREILKGKLNDIASIIAAYDAIIADKYLDPASELTRLYEKLLQLDYFCGKTVFIDGFNGFVAQEYKVLEVIIKQAKAVYITFCTDSDSNSNKYDLFSYVNSNISILYNVADKIGVKINEPVFLTEPKRFNNDELKAVEAFAFDNAKGSISLEKYDNVKIYRARSISDECDNAAFEISKLFKMGVRASKIAVICRDIDKYQKELEFSFKKYGIPFFDDERQAISSQPIIMFVSFLLRTAMFSLRSEDIFSLLKTGLTELSEDKISELENYAFMWSINGSAWKNDFENSTRGLVEEIIDSDRAAINSVNQSRKYVIDKLIYFRNSIKNKSCKDIAKAIYYCILDFAADKKLKELAISLDGDGKSALAQEQGRVWDLLMEMLDNLATVGGEQEISVKDFYNLFSLMLSYEDLGTIPTGLDNIQVGGADRIRCNNPYAVFLLGANEGEFPQTVTSKGLLSESDRVTLIDNDFKLYSYGETLNAQEKYFAYMAASAPSDRLYISYGGGENSEKSPIVKGVEKSLSGINEKVFSDDITVDRLISKDNAFDLLSYHFNDNNELVSSLKQYFINDRSFSGKVQALERLNDNKPVEIKNTQIATDLFKKDMYLSASKVDEYFKCAFKYFCKFGIGAKPRVKAEMDPMQTGTVIHYVLEQMIKDNPKDEFVNFSDEKIVIETNNYLKDFLENKIQSSGRLDSRFNYQFMRLSKMLSFVVIRLRDEFKQSDFEPKAFELKIGNEESEDCVKYIPIKLSDGGTITVKGSIDRVDTFVENGRQYVRVVDYKSGTKKFELSDILYGLNLQMFIYLFSLCNSNHNLKGIGSGVLYMHAAREVYSMSVKRDADNLNTEDDKAFKMHGVFLNDDENDIVRHMEKNMGKRGKYIDVSLTKNGYSGNIVSLEELGAISKKIDSLLVQMGQALHRGKIDQNPVEGGHNKDICSYCDYLSVCKNRKEITSRKTDTLTNDTVLAEILKGDDDNA